MHPDNPDLVYVAALGHSSKDNPERGLYRSKDGGENWELVLHVSDRAGAVDVSLDPNNPRIVFATIWQARRTFWSIDSGGPDSGLWRSRDGGDTWEDISHRPGMPDGMLGKIGVAVSPARSGRVFAMVEAEVRKRGLYRSDDFGETWEKVSSNPDLGWRPWYYQHVIAHPTNADEVFVMNMKAWRSIDGGKTFEEFHTPHGDNHALWIDPTNPDRMIGCDDGGAWVSFNAGEIVVDDLQPADRAVLPRGHRRPISVHRLRLAAGQLEHRGAQPQRSRRDQLGRLLLARHRRERLRRAEAGRSRTSCTSARSAARRAAASRLQRYDHTHQAGPARQRVARGVPRRQHRRGPLPVDVSDRVLAARHATCSTPPATRCSARPTKDTAGRRSAPISPTPIPTRWACPGR